MIPIEPLSDPELADPLSLGDDSPLAVAKALVLVVAGTVVEPDVVVDVVVVVVDVVVAAVTAVEVEGELELVVVVEPGAIVLGLVEEQGHEIVPPQRFDKLGPHAAEWSTAQVAIVQSYVTDTV